MTILDELAQLRENALNALEATPDLAALTDWKTSYLGKQSPLTHLSRSLGSLAPDERRSAGQQFNT